MPIVVVDDDRIGLMLVTELLEPLGQRVHGFTDPQAALAWIKANEPDLLITDLRMRGLGGLALTEQVRAMQHTADMPVMMLTTVEERARRIDAFTAGVTDFAVKPVDPTELYARASALLRLSLAQSALKHRARHLSGEVDQATAALTSREEEVIRRLATAADRRDHVTGDHIARVADYAKLIAEAMGLPPLRGAADRSRGAPARHRQDRRAGRCAEQTRQPDCGRTRGDGAAHALCRGNSWQFLLGPAAHRRRDRRRPP